MVKMVDFGFFTTIIYIQFYIYLKVFTLDIKPSALYVILFLISLSLAYFITTTLES